MMEKSVSIAKVKKMIASAAEANKADGAEGPPWLKYVAMLTGALAALAGFLTVRTTMLTNQAIYESNQAILSQTQASDTWAEYEADSIKARIIETQIVPSSPLSAEDKAALTKADNEIRDRQPKSKQDAEEKIKEREAHLAQGLKLMQQKDMLGYGGMAVQLGIVLASVAAMVRRKEAFFAGAIAGGAGIAITAYALLEPFLSR